MLAVYRNKLYPSLEKRCPNFFLMESFHHRLCQHALNGLHIVHEFADFLLGLPVNEGVMLIQTAIIGRLPVLTDKHQNGKEDGFKRDGEGEKVEGVLEAIFLSILELISQNRQ